MYIIGLGHYSRTGKDTFANYLTAGLIKQGIKALKTPFAWKLKQITHELYAWDGLREPEFYDTKEGEPYRDIMLPTIKKTPVEIWVYFGTQAVRNNVYDLTWVDYLLNNYNCDVLIIPDVRFPNETDAIKEKGGILIKVVRPGFGPRDTVADRALLGYNGWDFVIGAEGTISSLQRWSDLFVRQIVFGELVTQTEESRNKVLEVEKIENITRGICP